ncbi:sugar phosphate isomerase/epimerase [Reichenbachiella sp. MALMAid0571]|uniref:sugar phosphate isomerase/epimerase family protein n=1 Tax=Reichenbachiella sp. MALMAid0571 TaxID=3143939 RepID=UPI0032DE4FDC
MEQTRRQFLTNVSVAGTGLALSGMNMITENKTVKSGFGIKFYATRWGYQGSMDAFCRRVKAEGYDGVEDWLPGDKAQEEALFEALDKYNLSYGALAGSGGNDLKEHMESYSQNLKKVILKKPDFINSHAGRDFLSFEESTQLIHLGIDYSKESGIPVYQETHRGRMLFAAHVCKPFIDSIPELRLTLDISHWCAVAESLLGNQKETIAKVLDRTEHIHSRIGHEEGPQVSDPRAPEWKRAKDAHYAWWDAVVARKKAAGELLTVTTEFGPASYMWTLPYTQQPIADQWAINVHMMNEWKERYL